MSPTRSFVRVFSELDVAVGSLSLLPGWDRRTGSALVSYLANVMHKRTGSNHAVYVEALAPAHLPGAAMRVLRECLRLGIEQIPSSPVEL